MAWMETDTESDLGNGVGDALTPSFNPVFFNRNNQTTPAYEVRKSNSGDILGSDKIYNM